MPTPDPAHSKPKPKLPESKVALARTISDTFTQAFASMIRFQDRKTAKSGRVCRTSENPLFSSSR